MKSFLLLMALIFTSAAASAEAIYGNLVTAPSTVTVTTQSGSQVDYMITAILNTGSIDGEYNSITLSQNGMMAMCGDYLGQLAKDFSITITTKDGITKSATVRAADENRKVSVFGMCTRGSNILTQLQIDIQKGEGLEIQ